MKVFRNLLDGIKPNFEKGGKLEKLYPAYDAFETFLFVPDHTTKEGTHIKDAIDLKRTMFMVIVALIPCVLFGMWNVGYQYSIASGESMTFIQQFNFRILEIFTINYSFLCCRFSSRICFRSIKRASSQ